MHFQDNDRTWLAPASFLLFFLRRNIPIVVFLLLATAGMMAVYWYFNPTTSSVESVAAASTGDQALSAPLYKKVPSRPVTQRLAQSPGPLRIGIIAGHKGFDSGAVCADGLTETEVNENIARKVVANLEAQGIKSDLLDEFDARLRGYWATAVVSIHSDSCIYYNELATGYKIAGSSRTDSSQLSICIEQAYGEATQLSYHANTITPHMTDYHAFREIALGTPAIIIEVGFMNLDRELLTNGVDTLATGLTNGVLCFLEQK